ncbi:hypothetical protein TRV_04525 [Trichophyton verrucosum HKI 0517]|uniref:Uncharacterized protein n=1 Tax=Trichophyton verrucosum (strain HKI 0517) TaxID=663202 RepID=D4DBM5_TRIVH|nr:uncharacterized protein TRV_04525 [Trichophyton verrucosum HKI 0517]EFE40752.1 hypothetical protein TRV_04525 [Trichophyton verrucosum HKI 0517]
MLASLFSSSSSSSASSSLSTPEQDETMTFYMSIKWIAPDEPFSAPGDSGSLVYTFFDNSIVPLGIHYGSDGDESQAYLLDSWFTEIEAILNCDGYFCELTECKLGSVTSSASFLTQLNQATIIVMASYVLNLSSQKENNFSVQIL